MNNEERQVAILMANDLGFDIATSQELGKLPSWVVDLIERLVEDGWRKRDE